MIHGIAKGIKENRRIDRGMKYRRMSRLAVAVMLSAMVLGGCRAREVTNDIMQLPQENAELNKADGNEDRNQTEKTPESPALWTKDMNAATVLEDENAVYICGTDHIRKVDKESGRTQNIWESAEGKTDNYAYVYSSSRGILVKDTLYFIEMWEGEEEAEAGTTVNYALSVVHTDGSGYERIRQVSGNAAAKMVLLDGILYFDEGDNALAMQGYAVDENGNFVSREVVTFEDEKLMDSYLVPYYNKNGSRGFTAAESRKKLGYYLIRDENYNMCRIYPESGKKEQLPDLLQKYSLEAVNDHSLLFSNYKERELYLADAKTFENKVLASYEGSFNMIFMDNEYLYFQRCVPGDGLAQCYYEKMELATGKVTELFVLDEFVGMGASLPTYLLPASVLNGYLYYADEMDYKFYIMRCALDIPTEEENPGDAFHSDGYIGEKVGEDFFDSRIGEVGSVKTYRENIYNEKNPDTLLATLDLEKLEVDEAFPGADKINRILEQEQEEKIAFERESVKSVYAHASESDIPSVVFSFDSNVSPVSYMDGTYFSFVQQNYDYTGGAHGMPSWTGYVFDLQTGKKLGLSDIAEVEENALKELVVRYFTQIYEKDPEMYWNDAEEFVYENITLDSSFYLSEEGIVFYFGPYELASYAAGFQEVVVPYSEFTLKIPLVYE